MSFWNQLVDRFRGGADEEIDWEPLLIEADLGVKLATEWVEEIRDKGLARSPEKAELFLRDKMAKLVRVPPPLPILQSRRSSSSSASTAAARLPPPPNSPRARRRRDARSISAPPTPSAPPPPSSWKRGARASASPSPAPRRGPIRPASPFGHY